MPTATSSNGEADIEIVEPKVGVSTKTATTPPIERDDDKHPPEYDGAGETLVAEAKDLLDQRKWKAATKVAQSAKRLRPDDIDVDAILAIAAANTWRRSPGDPVGHLRALVTAPGLSHADRATGYSALAVVSLSARDHRQADDYARKAVGLDPSSVRGWWSLSASYAGLGWFEESATCRRRAEVLDPASFRTLPPLMVGRATNYWAMTNARAALATIVSVVIFGILGLAIAVSWPFLAREYRTAQLDEETRNLADRAWIENRAPRIIGGLLVLTIVAVWAATLAYVP